MWKQLEHVQPHSFQETPQVGSKKILMICCLCTIILAFAYCNRKLDTYEWYCFHSIGSLGTKDHGYPNEDHALLDGMERPSQSSANNFITYFMINHLSFIPSSIILGIWTSVLYIWFFKLFPYKFWTMGRFNYFKIWDPIFNVYVLWKLKPFNT